MMSLDALIDLLHGWQDSLIVAHLRIDRLVVNFLPLTLVRRCRLDNPLCLALKSPLKAALLLLPLDRHWIWRLSSWKQILSVLCQTKLFDELWLQDFLQFILHVVSFFVCLATEHVFLKHATIILHTLELKLLIKWFMNLS